MKKDLIDKALSAVHSRKRKAELEFETTMQPLYSDPTFQELNKKMIRLTIENAKNEAYGENDKNSNCQVEQGRKSTAVETSLSKENLISQLETLKKKYNLQNEEPHYSCKKCQDNGYQNGEMCACLKREISNILLKESGFEKLENFENAQKTKKACELKEEITSNLIDKYNDLVKSGKTQEESYNIAISNMGNIEDLVSNLQDENNKWDTDYIRKTKKKVSNTCI